MLDITATGGEINSLELMGFMSCEVPNLFTLSVMHKYEHMHINTQARKKKNNMDTVKMPPLYSK